MDEASLVPRETFDRAVTEGDLETVAAFFAQPEVRTRATETDAFISEALEAGAELDPATVTLPDGSWPWFRRAKTSPIDTDDVPLLCAARNGHAHVVQWFFSRERAAFMGATLAFLLPLIALFDGPRKWNHHNWTGDPLVLEALLSSDVFCGLPDDQRQSLLDAIASYSQNPQLISLAIAHGARVNEALASIARVCQKDCVQMLDGAGALLVGADVLRGTRLVYVEYTHADSFLFRGVDWGSQGTARLLIDAVKSAHIDAVNTLLWFSYVDVDAPDEEEDGMTALMHVAAVEGHEYDASSPAIALSLLEYAHVDCVDHSGRTALHYAAESNPAIAELLLESGADPTRRDQDGLAAVDFLADDVFVAYDWQKLLTLFLDAGADPFTVPCRSPRFASRSGGEVGAARRSLYDRLTELPGGCDFMQSHPQYFTRKESEQC